jgi:hypothetical protein
MVRPDKKSGIEIQFISALPAGHWAEQVDNSARSMLQEPSNSGIVELLWAKLAS